MPMLEQEIIVQPDFVERRLSWKERLFSWPWRPLRKTKWVPNQIWEGIPETDVYHFGGKLIMRESQMRKLSEEVFTAAPDFHTGGIYRGSGASLTPYELPMSARNAEFVRLKKRSS